MRLSPAILLPALLSVSLPAFAAPVPRNVSAPSAELQSKCDALLARWKDKFDDAKFNAVAEPPFVVAGDASKLRLRRHVDNTILPASRALRTMYFKTEASEPTLILLFEDADTYQRLAKEWFGDQEVPHFGFYRRRENVMLMNISTGGGTLVHEMVHALLAPDFPDCPDWLNEGLASLYEQSSFGPAGDSIRGLANWRLPALQKAIKEKTLRPFTELIADPRFYADENVGINYAQARYLMMYLQEKGLLKKFYADAREGAKKDPTAQAALTALIAPKTLGAFEAEWRRWVLTLRFQ
jgi:hypothetical protein